MAAVEAIVGHLTEGQLSDNRPHMKRIAKRAADVRQICPYCMQSNSVDQLASYRRTVLGLDWASRGISALIAVLLGLLFGFWAGGRRRWFETKRSVMTLANQLPSEVAWNITYGVIAIVLVLIGILIVVAVYRRWLKKNPETEQDFAAIKYKCGECKVTWSKKADGSIVRHGVGGE